MSWLPDAEAEYASMKRLTSIDVSYSEFLQNFPVGWGLVPRQILAVDSCRLRLSNVQRLIYLSLMCLSTENRKAHLSVIEKLPSSNGVPPSFCKYNNSLKTLTLGNGTRASFVLDWSNQRTRVAVEINDACEGAWKEA